jgi:hypothetical protein
MMTMTEDLTNILIFKTNISTFSDKLRLQKLFLEKGAVDEWHVDSEDVDCVLRVVSSAISAGEIIQLLGQAGFECEELQ